MNDEEITIVLKGCRQRAIRELEKIRANANKITFEHNESEKKQIQETYNNKNKIWSKCIVM